MNQEHPTGTERKSLNYECGWKSGDIGGLAWKDLGHCFRVADPLPCDLVPTPLATWRCLLVRQNQAIPFEPKIAVLIGSYVVRPRAHLRSMNYSVLFLTHLIGAAIGEERVIRAEFLRICRFFRVYPVRVIRIGERHAHMTCRVVHEVANWVRAILRIRLECSIAPECPSRNQPPSPDEPVTRNA